ncbi:MAG: peptidoglycan recognition family protein [Bacteriovoracaceae bacterium]
MKIGKPTLKRNPKAELCKRDTGMIDTIVFHHTATSPNQTITNINNYQLTQGGDDPWLMIAYHFTISGAYPGEKTPAANIQAGRPVEIIGSHTGKGTYATPSAEATKVIKDNPPTCGKEGGKFVLDKKLYGPDGRSRANASTIGVVIIGNYAPYSSKNETGYKKNKPRYPTEDMLIQAAKLSCEIQRQYPSVKFIKWHDFYKPTGCPGTVEQKIPRIVELTKGYGCDFSS